MGNVVGYIAAAGAVFVVHLFVFAKSLSADGIFSSYAFGRVISAPLCYLSMFVFALALITRLSIAASKNKEGRINPKVWTYVKATGEYHRITSARDGEFLYNNDNHSKRFIKWMERAQRAENNAIFWLCFGFVILCAGKYAEFNNNMTFYYASMIDFFGIFVMWIGAWVWASAERGRWDMVGPRPIQTGGVDDVERQKAFGDARAADVADIHRALGGGAGSAANVTAPRGPIFEE